MTRGARVHHVAPVAAAALLVVVTACAPSGGGAGAGHVASSEVEQLGTPAPQASLGDSVAPASWAGVPAVDPGWDHPPLEADGLLLGFREPPDGGPLVFTAVDGHGELLWRTERPPACSGFTLSRAGDRPVAVLTDAADGGFGTTASAYDLATGERLWGPVDVPGPYQGPGLVFAEPAPAMGETGPRVALDPSSGRVAVTGSADVGVVGEHDGVVLLHEGDVLRAVDAASGAEAWSRPVAALGASGGDLVAPAGARAPSGTALLASRADLGADQGDGGSGAALVDVVTGDVLATGVTHAVREPLVGVTVVAGPGTGSAGAGVVPGAGSGAAAGEAGAAPRSSGVVVRGLDADGELWAVDAAPDARPTAAGGALVYLREGDAVRALNVMTGADAVAYEGTGEGYLVPSRVTATGAAVVRTDRYLVLAPEAP